MNSRRPHVMVINTDHWPASLLGAAGHPAIRTPTLDALARGGVRYSNAYSECPVCIPARRSLMTGTAPRTHGDRVYSDTMEMPAIPTLAQAFREGGYQTYGVGKLHVYPQRDRIGFDDVCLMEEARYDFGVVDDYQIWLGEQGYVGQEYLHGMGNNGYTTRPWHLPEEAHPTNWATRRMINTLKRKDPRRPGFYYLSYQAPHPPLVPLPCYWDMYRRADLPEILRGDWVSEGGSVLQGLTEKAAYYSSDEKQDALRAFYALCTHVDHQIRLIIGTLRETGLLDDTIILFLSDHGDMLFQHDMTAKRVFYENAANIPFILSGKPVEHLAGRVDDRLVCLADVMPSLLELCGLSVPSSAEGLSCLGNEKRDFLYGEIGEGPTASRMAHDGRFKLIYYPVGNRVQLFDLQEDPGELTNLAGRPELAEREEALRAFLISSLYKGDEAWAREGRLVGLEDRPFVPRPDYSLYNQRGGHWPVPSGYKTLGKNL